MKVWHCKIGMVAEECLPQRADAPMRKAVEAAYQNITGKEPGFIFSGWNGELKESELAIVENRNPVSDVLAVSCMTDNAKRRVSEKRQDYENSWEDCDIAYLHQQLLFKMNEQKALLVEGKFSEKLALDIINFSSFINARANRN